MSKYIIISSDWLREKRFSNFRQLDYATGGFCFTAGAYWIRQSKTQEQSDVRKVEKYKKALIAVIDDSKDQKRLIERHDRAAVQREELRAGFRKELSNLEEIYDINTEAMKELAEKYRELLAAGGRQVAMRTHDNPALNLKELLDYITLLRQGSEAVRQKIQLAKQCEEKGDRQQIGKTTVSQSYLSVVEEYGLKLVGGIEGVGDDSVGNKVIGNIPPGQYFILNLLDDGGHGGHSIAGQRIDSVKGSKGPRTILFDANTGLVKSREEEKLINELFRSYRKADKQTEWAFPKWSLYLVS